MTENTKDLSTTYDEKTATESENNSNHEHSNHSHSHHSHSHHSHSHHRHHGSSNRSAKKGKFSLIAYIQRKSTSRTAKQIPRYRVASQRILFCLLLLSFILGALAGVLNDDSETVNSGVLSTRSETDQLKTQITILQMEKAALQGELDKYKALYGELVPENQNNN